MVDLKCYTEHAYNEMTSRGQIVPVLILVAKGRQLEMPYPVSDWEKERALLVLRSLRVSSLVEQVICLYEAWSTEYSSSELSGDVPEVRPRDSDRRKEVVVLTTHTSSGHTVYHSDIIRSESGTSLTEFKELDCDTTTWLDDLWEE